jgi:Leucine Rich repeat
LQNASAQVIAAAFAHHPIITNSALELTAKLAHLPVVGDAAAIRSCIAAGDAPHSTMLAIDVRGAQARSYCDRVLAALPHVTGIDSFSVELHASTGMSFGTVLAATEQFLDKLHGIMPNAAPVTEIQLLGLAGTRQAAMFRNFTVLHWATKFMRAAHDSSDGLRKLRLCDADTRALEHYQVAAGSKPRSLSQRRVPGCDVIAAFAPQVSHMGASLRVLELRNCYMTDKGACALAPHLLHCYNLQELDLCANDIIGSAHIVVRHAVNAAGRLTKLILTCNPIGDVGMAQLALELGRLPRIEALQLENMDVGPVGAAALLDALSSASCLAQLCVGGNQLGKEGQAGVRAFVAGMPQLTDVSTAEVDDVLGDIDADLAEWMRTLDPGVTLAGKDVTSKLITEVGMTKAQAADVVSIIADTLGNGAKVDSRK